MTRDQINQLWTESATVADFLIAIGVVKADEPEVKSSKNYGSVDNYAMEFSEEDRQRFLDELENHLLAVARITASRRL